MSIKSCEKVAFIYLCEKCDYKTSRKSSYDKHISTSKHQKSIKSIESCEKVATKFYCEVCDKYYKEPVVCGVIKRKHNVIQKKTIITIS